MTLSEQEQLLTFMLAGVGIVVAVLVVSWVIDRILNWLGGVRDR